MKATRLPGRDPASNANNQTKPKANRSLADAE
jgi:hypothetical protein